MKLWGRHPDDQRLLTGYVAERTGDLVDPPFAEHLAECADCRRRYDGLAGFMDELRTDADASVDALYPADRLEAQRSSIARRIAHLGHAARVITFPGRASEVATPLSPRRRSSRWIAAAAVAGLLVGILLGTLSNMREATPPVEVAVSAPAADEPLTVRAPMDDDTFLRELELASIRQRARAISPLDAFTPTVREVNAQVR
ncbi:MAG: hypothetical protein AB7F99_03040 [Vicinamibacterales bacterium]